MWPLALKKGPRSPRSPFRSCGRAICAEANHTARIAEHYPVKRLSVICELGNRTVVCTMPFADSKTARGFVISASGYHSSFPKRAHSRVGSHAGPTPIALARYPFGVHCQCMLDATTAKMIEDWNKNHIMPISRGQIAALNSPQKSRSEGRLAIR